MLARPERFFADRFGLNAGTMERLLGSTLAGRVDHADLYLEYRISEELVLEEGAVKKAARHVSQGAGIRAQSGERTGYAERGYRLSCNTGPEGGQVVDHLHFHFTAGRR